MNEGNTKRAGRTKRAAVALLVALAIFAGRLDPTGPIDAGRPPAARISKESSNG
jgi:hypothetical protein